MPAPSLPALGFDTAGRLYCSSWGMDPDRRLRARARGRAVAPGSRCSLAPSLQPWTYVRIVRARRRLPEVRAQVSKAIKSSFFEVGF